MREHSIVTFLRLAAVIDGRNPRQLRRLIGMPESTLKRYVSLLRQCGMVVTFDRAARAYRIVDAGPFDLVRLRQMSLGRGRMLVVLPRAA